ncbi:MAG: DNRLRE domain-containing protein [Saprospiraceae bacterium]|nr:DNRLRE domain-containing protein [Saprospiraceae bacterium]
MVSFKSTNTLAVILVIGMLCVCTSARTQTSTDFFPEKDNSIYSENNNSNALGDLFAGRTNATGGGSLRRALLKFDLSAIPTTATVTAVTLTLTKNQGGSGNTSLHKLEMDWGEGTSSEGPGGPGSGGGQGAAPTTDDATWDYRFWQTLMWNTSGGDFSGTASATILVGSANTTYSWSSSEMVDDVQNWVENPSGNFGWIIIGNESTNGTTSRFNSREDTSGKPVLSVTYTTTSCPDTLELTGIIFGTHRANMLIRASGTVKDTSVAVFKTLGEVVLDPNFTVEQGGTITIEQEGCN